MDRQNHQYNRGGGRGGGQRGGFRGGGQTDRHTTHQQPKETPDHSPIGDIEGLIARLGDSYLTLDDPNQINLYNHYNHQFDISLPPHDLLEPFYKESIPLQLQIRKIGDYLKPLLLKSTLKDNPNIERIASTIFRCIIAFPTKINVYAALVAYLGIEYHYFITLIINESFKQLEASIKGLFIVMLLEKRKKYLELQGTGKSRLLLQLLSSLTLAATPTTTITTPAIHYEAYLRFISSLVGYGCITYTNWSTILMNILAMCQIPLQDHKNGNYDEMISKQFSTLHPTNDDNVRLSMYLPDALPFELSSITAVIEALSQSQSTNDTISNVVAATTTDTTTTTTNMNDNYTTTTTNGYEDDSEHVNSPQYRTTPVLTTGSEIHFTAFSDVIIHGILSALVFASRDILNYGYEHNNKNNGQVHTIFQNEPNVLNCDSILFNIGTNWYNNVDSRSIEDIDVEVDYSFEGNSKTTTPILLPTIDTNNLTTVIIDGIEMKLTVQEVFYCTMFKSISTYLYYRSQAFTFHNTYQSSLSLTYKNIDDNTTIPMFVPTTLTITSPYSTSIGQTFDFFAHPELYQDDKKSIYQSTPIQAIDSATDLEKSHFDYLSWSYWCITGSLPDGAIHIIRSQQDTNSIHSWGLLTRPFSLPTPQRQLKTTIRNHYIHYATQQAINTNTTSSKNNAAKLGELYVFSAPGPIDTKHIYIIPSTDPAIYTSSTTNSTTTTTTTSTNTRVGRKVGSTVSNTTMSTKDLTSTKKLSKKLHDYLLPYQTNAQLSYTTHYPPSKLSPTIYFLTQPAAFPPILPILPPRPIPPTIQQNNGLADPIQNRNNPNQSKYTVIQNTNNIDVWLTYSYLFYSNLTYSGLQEEYLSFLSTLPPLYPIWGFSQSTLFHTNPEGPHYLKYARQYSSTSRQTTVTTSTIPLVISFFFSLIISNHNNLIEPLTLPMTNIDDSKPFIHKSLTWNYKSNYISTLIRLMYEHSTKVPSYLGPRFFQLFKLLPYFCLESRQQLSTWFAEHLVQFNFMFPWTHFAFLNELIDPTHIQYTFMVNVLSRCVHLTSFSTVAANIRQLWALLPAIQQALSTLKPKTLQASSNVSLTNNTTDPTQIFATNTTITNPQQIGMEQQLLLIPHIITHPLLNEPLIVLHKALKNNTNKYLLLTLLYFTPNLFSPSLIQSFTQHLMESPTLQIASQYNTEITTTQYLTTPLASTYRVKHENVNIYACYLWLSLLITSKTTTTHFQYFLQQYGDILTILSNTLPNSELHDGFYNNLSNHNNNSTLLTTVPGHSSTSKLYDTIDPTQQPQLLTNIITNSNFIYVPTFPSTMLYQNGFLLCPIVDNTNSICQGRTLIASIPNPTQLILLDLLTSFYHYELSYIMIKLQYLISFNIISIQSVIIWLLFYLPRDEQLKGTIFNPLIIETLYLIIDYYLMANNEKESKFLDLIKTTFTSIPTITKQVTNDTTNTTTDNTMGDAATTTTTTTTTTPATTTITIDDVTPAIIDRVSKIQDQNIKIINYKVNFFSTIFALLYEWITDWDTLLSVLQTQSLRRRESFSQVGMDIVNNDNETIQQDSKRQKMGTNNSIDDELSSITLIYGTNESIQKYVSNIIVALLVKYKISLRNISKDIIDHCNIPGLEPLMKQVFQ